MRGWCGAAAYAAAKGALLGLVRPLAVEGASRGMTAKAVLPGAHPTLKRRVAWPLLSQ